MASGPSEDGDRGRDTDAACSSAVALDQEHARPRRRTRRACDKCSTSRTRCDGECPCRRCQDYGYSCRYNRTVKKRGRIPASGSIGSALGSWMPSNPRRSGHEIDDSRCLPTEVLPQVKAADLCNYKAVPPGAFSPPVGQPDPMDEDDTQTMSPRDINPPQLALPGISTVMTVPSLAQSNLQRPPHLFPATHSHLCRPRAASSSASAMDGHLVDSEVVISDESADYPSPSNGATNFDFQRTRRDRGSFLSATSTAQKRTSISTTATAPDAFLPDIFQKTSGEECHYKFLDPILPSIRNIIPVSVACELVDIFLTDPGSSLFRGASPYILTRIFRKKSVTHPSNPRYTTPALLATILWCVAQTADVMLLHVPGARSKVVNDLYGLATALMSERDPDRWRRIHGGTRAEEEVPCSSSPTLTPFTTNSSARKPTGTIDDVLTFILLSIAVSGGDFKSDCYKWWSKAVRLALSLGLNREDERCAATASPCANPLCSCHRDQKDASLADVVFREERRRVFWLLYSLDRHLSLSFNTVLSMPDSYCEVFAPLPENIWEDLDHIALKDLPARTLGPPMVVSGTGFFEYYLPLMAILGDIIEVHHRRRHPRLGEQGDTPSVVVIQELLAKYELSLNSMTCDDDFESQSPLGVLAHSGRETAKSPAAPLLQLTQGVSSSPCQTSDGSKFRLVKAYSTHILHVLHVLLHGKWDAISMLDDGDDWITSKRFNECASHAISASQSVSTILTIDPELTFMSYLFGIYLLQGSFILLLFADRMPQLGVNESVEQACENIIRAHEVCVVTLNTEFQKNFRKVVRSALYSVRGSGTINRDEYRARRRALSLYRWTKGAKGLAL